MTAKGKAVTLKLRAVNIIIIRNLYIISSIFYLLGIGGRERLPALPQINLFPALKYRISKGLLFAFPY